MASSARSSIERSGIEGPFQHESGARPVRHLPDRESARERERERQQHSIVLTEADRLRPRLTGGVPTGVSEHRALRVAGRARRVTDRCDIIGVDGDRRWPVGDVLDGQIFGHEHRLAISDVAEACGERGLSDDDRAPGIFHDVRHFGCDVPNVHRHRNRAELPARDADVDELRAVTEQHSDAVAVTEGTGAESRSESVGACIEFSPSG